MEINSLVESIRLDIEPDDIIIYDLEQHLKRLQNSARELNLRYDLNKDQILGEIKNFFDKENLTLSSDIPSANKQKIFKLRVILEAQRGSRIEFQPYTKDLNRIFKLKILDSHEFQINSKDVKWKHKFMPRIDFSQYFLRYSCDELVWTNEMGQICEGSYTNIFVQDDQGNWLTPKLESNILAGIMRGKFIERLKAKESFLYPQDIQNARKVLLCNSLIGGVEAKLN